MLASDIISLGKRWKKMKNIKKIVMIGLVTTLLLATTITSQAIPQLDLQAPSMVNEGQNFFVRVVIHNGGNGSGNETPVANASIRPSWTNNTYYTDGNGLVLLTAPQVSSTTVFGIFASKLGYLSDYANITIVNVGHGGGKMKCCMYPDGEGN